MAKCQGRRISNLGLSRSAVRIRSFPEPTVAVPIILLSAHVNESGKLPLSWRDITYSIGHKLKTTGICQGARLNASNSVCWSRASACQTFDLTT